MNMRETLLKDENIMELLELLRQYKEREREQGFLNTVSYVEGLEQTLAKMMEQITDMKVELSAVREQNEYLIAKSNRRVKDATMEQVEKIEQKVQEFHQKVENVKHQISEKAKEISDAVKQFGKLAFVKMADFMHIKDGLNKINDSVTHTMMRLNEIEKSVKQEVRNQSREQSMDAPESVGTYAEEMKKFMESKVAEGVSYATNGEAYEAFKEYYDEKVKGEAQFEAEINKAVASQMQEQRSGR